MNNHPGLIGLVVVLVLLVGACGGGDEEGSLSDLEIIGVDFELNSIVITNNGSRDVRTQGLWAHGAGASFEFNIFTIEPRDTIRFSVSDLGEIQASGGAIALADSGDLSSPESLLQFVAWGEDGSTLRQVAVDAELWPQDETVETTDDTLILVKTAPASSGPMSWEASEEVGGG